MTILCVGQLVADILVKPVDSIDFSVDTKRVDLITVKGGGDSYNTATALAKLDQPVKFVGKCGCDSFGDLLYANARDAGIDVSSIVRDPSCDTSAVIVALNPEGERVFLYYGGANDTFTYGDIPPDALDGCGIVHVGGTYNLPLFDGEGAARLFALAQSRGILTSMDVTYDVSGRWLEIIRPCLPHLDYFMPSAGEARMITGRSSPEEMAAFLLDLGVRNVVIKLGGEGCYLQNEHTSFYTPAFEVEVADTTGAGDCFAAGFLTGLSQRWNLERCAQFACAVAAMCVTQVGATTGVPTFPEIEKFIAQQR